MLIDILNKINSINENMFSGFDTFVENFGMPDWLCDAIIDSFHVLPLLFIVFLFIEFIEYFYSELTGHFVLLSKAYFITNGKMIKCLCLKNN